MSKSLKQFITHVRAFLIRIAVNIVLPTIHRLFIFRLKRKKKINVVFIAMTLSMWRYQKLYELFSANPRYNVTVVLLPFRSYSIEQQAEDLKQLRLYFDAMKVKCKSSFTKFGLQQQILIKHYCIFSKNHRFRFAVTNNS